MSMREIPIIVPHMDHGDPECCGCIFPVVRGDLADLVCNECGAVVLTVRATDAEQRLVALAATDTLCTYMCPHCGSLNTFPGFTSMIAYICQHCDGSVVVQSEVQ